MHELVVNYTLRQNLLIVDQDLLETIAAILQKLPLYSVIFAGKYQQYYLFCMFKWFRLNILCKWGGGNLIKR